ncbi:MAG: hypothetical protein AAFV53_27945 [Myxococcota bacterium]
MRVAMLCSAHGFGHVTRQLALARHLLDRGGEAVFFTAAPPDVLQLYLPAVTVRSWAIDVGLIQQDGLTQDLPATCDALLARCHDDAIDALATELVGFDLALVDAPPPGMEACRRAGVPTIAVGNFSWPWIYDRLPDPGLHDWARRFRDWQRPHRAISLWPGPGLSDHDFAGVERFGLVGRQATPHPLPPGAILVSFGGFGLRDLDRLLPRIDGIRWVLAPPMPALDRSDCLYVEAVPYPALVAGAEMVLTKPGYGIFAEAALGRTRLLWVDRGAFPEAAFIAQAMTDRGDLPLGPVHAPDFAARLRDAIDVSRRQGAPAPMADDTARLAGRLFTPSASARLRS